MINFMLALFLFLAFGCAHEPMTPEQEKAWAEGVRGIGEAYKPKPVVNTHCTTYGSETNCQTR